MERFIKEYANYQKKVLINNELMKNEYKEKGCNKIDRLLKARENGFITVSETMDGITNCLQ